MPCGWWELGALDRCLLSFSVIDSDWLLVILPTPTTHPLLTCCHGGPQCGVGAVLQSDTSNQLRCISPNAIAPKMPLHKVLWVPVSDSLWADLLPITLRSMSYEQRLQRLSAVQWYQWYAFRFKDSAIIPRAQPILLRKRQVEILKNWVEWTSG